MNSTINLKKYCYINVRGLSSVSKQVAKPLAIKKGKELVSNT